MLRWFCFFVQAGWLVVWAVVFTHYHEFSSLDKLAMVSYSLIVGYFSWQVPPWIERKWGRGVGCPVLRGVSLITDELGVPLLLGGFLAAASTFLLRLVPSNWFESNDVLSMLVRSAAWVAVCAPVGIGAVLTLSKLLEREKTAVKT